MVGGLIRLSMRTSYPNPLRPALLCTSEKGNLTFYGPLSKRILHYFRGCGRFAVPIFRGIATPLLFVADGFSIEEVEEFLF